MGTVHHTLSEIWRIWERF